MIKLKGNAKNEELSLPEELTLMLMYLTSWKESKAVSLRANPPVNDGNDYFQRSWTDY
ncbi:MAG: hypothetical protein J5569_04720 [Oscillospiraceae bacterium]|nr:hypothetical protein [Oscillospiraceae bacterium]